VGIGFGDVVSATALFLSGYAVWTTSRFNKRQLKLMERQEQLADLEISRNEVEKRVADSADMGANLVKVSRNNWRLKLYNRGPAIARNVRMEFPDGNDLVVESEVRDKLPMEMMEQHQVVELICAIYIGSKVKHRIQIIWDDASHENRSKFVDLTI
jgi:hypothetical protein